MNSWRGDSHKTRRHGYNGEVRFSRSSEKKLEQSSRVFILILVDQCDDSQRHSLRKCKKWNQVNIVLNIPDNNESNEDISAEYTHTVAFKFNSCSASHSLKYSYAFTLLRCVIAILNRR